VTGPLSPLERAYRDPGAAARAHRAAGGLVVGCVGADVPRELLHAAGLLAVWLTGAPGQATADADRYLGTTTDPVARSQLGRLLSGEFDFLDQLLISHDSESSLRLFTCLREIQRVEPRPGLPTPCFVDVLHLPYRTSAVYNRIRLRQLTRTLGEWTGTAVSDAAISVAVRTCNDNRKLLAQVSSLRTAAKPLLTGAAALAVTGAGRFIPVEEHSRLLQQLLDSRDQLAPAAGVRIFVTGSATEHPGTYQAIESCGAVIVAEDHDWGERGARDLVTESADPIDGLADHYQFGPPAAAKYSIAERAAWTARSAVRVGAAAVIGLGRVNDPAPGWDFPAQRDALRQHGIPMLYLDHQPYEPAPDAATLGRVAEFLDSVSSKAEATL
jgi:benzoyl-CoA reductase/2-hydroxyglutaryl-CoA dehydratase subunit BcrC/BadD/HgdB